jgi:murein DD-endopeptidase MepM/ murein hydrolase activator NlpD
MNWESFFSQFSFHPVVDLPETYEVYDFTKGYDADRLKSSPYGVGKFKEKRAGMYTTELFTKDQHPRDIHMGIDIAAPAGSDVFACFAGSIFCATINAAAGDYGGTIITEHTLKDQTFWILHGHLSHESIAKVKAGKKFEWGDTLAQLGDTSENGGWNPHLHFQISTIKPLVCDMPGAVCGNDLEKSLQIYLDPRFILGPLY